MTKIVYFETKNTMNLKNLKNFHTGLALDLFDNNINGIDDDVHNLDTIKALNFKILKP